MRLGVAIYCHLINDENKLINYLKLLTKYKVDFIFTTLIGVQKDKVSFLSKIKFLGEQTKKQGIDVYIDVDNDVFKNFNLKSKSAADLVDFFQNKLNAKGIRCDSADKGLYEKDIAITNNSTNFKLILNGSDPSDSLKEFLDHGANSNNLLSCDNFYPQRFTAPSVIQFKKSLFRSNQFKIGYEAFITSQDASATGPWEFFDKAPTLEMHRDLSLSLQYRHLQVLGCEGVIVSSQFCTEEELKELFYIRKNGEFVKLDFEPIKDLNPSEKEIIYDDDVHFVRPDMAKYMLRSTISRIKYHSLDIPERKNKKLAWHNNSTISEFDENKLSFGDVIILNNHALNYKGELHIVIKEMPLTKYSNYVGRIKINNYFIVKDMQPFQKFFL